MSTHTVTKKRKSFDGSASATKKVKVAKSADKPAPVKSALKKPAVDAKKVKTKTRTTPKTTIPQHEVKRDKHASKSAKPTERKEKVLIQDNDPSALTADQTASLLAGFSSDSDDNAADDADANGIPIATLPSAPTTGDIPTALTSSTTRPSDPDRTPGVVYIGRIPHGFHEAQMRAYFSQFGALTHVKLARNRRTGRSKHFGFLEFASTNVADIVARTMDKYLLFGHVLQVRRVPAEQVGDGMWVGEGRRGWNVRPGNKLERGALRRGRTRGEWEKVVGREERRRERKGKVLSEMGYEFEMPKVRGVGEVSVKGGEIGEGSEAGVGLDEVEKAVEEKAEGNTVVEEEEEKEKGTKKRPAAGKPKVKEAKKVVKKVKT